MCFSTVKVGSLIWEKGKIKEPQKTEKKFFHIIQKIHLDGIKYLLRILSINLRGFDHTGVKVHKAKIKQNSKWLP